MTRTLSLEATPSMVAQNDYFDNETLSDIVANIWETVMGLTVTARCAPQYSQGARGLAVSVHIVGAWNGTVLYMPPEAVARRTAASMLDIAIEEVNDEDMQDAASELCNMIAGNLKSILPGPSSLSLPMVAEGADFELRVRGSVEISRVTLRCEHDSFQVLVLQSQQVGS